MEEQIKQVIKQALNSLSLPEIDFVIEQTTDFSRGDYASNVALLTGKNTGKNPLELAEQIVEEVKKNKPAGITEVMPAGPGFINFRLSDDFLTNTIERVLSDGSDWGKGDLFAGQKVMVEYTDPNIFKVFHIGHLVGNVIGESVSRMFEFSGADISRVCYQGDVGMHIAKSIWGLRDKVFPDSESVYEKVKVLGRAYSDGSNSYEQSEEVKKEIIAINKKIYERNDEEINRLYDLGKAWSLEYFETIYKKLGTGFDLNFFESETGGFGKEIVLSHPEIFEDGDNGAKIYRGEKDGLHTRVFVNSEGLPTYEAKEIGLVKIKHDRFSYDLSVVVAGNEIKEYFKIILLVMGKIFPDLAKKTRYINHGMLRLPTGKMSSRTGNIISADDLIDQVKEKVSEKVADRDSISVEVVEQVAVGAIKYSILKQDPSKDIVFDFDKSLSFEGNSGPYLQYTFARANSVLEKGREAGIVPGFEVRDNPGDIERIIARFPEISNRAVSMMAPQHIATYAIELASSFNSYYAENQIVGVSESPYRLALTSAVAQTLSNCLWLLGMSAPERM